MSRTSEKIATSARRGFTLVELLLVVTLMGVLTAIALPKLNVVHERTRLDQGAQTFAAYVRTGRLEAVKRGLSTRIEFLEDRTAYRLRVQDPSAKFESAFIEANDSLFDSWQSFPDGIKVSKVTGSRGTTAPLPITLAPSGVADTEKVVLVDRNQKTLSIRLGALPDVVEVIAEKTVAQ